MLIGRKTPYHQCQEHQHQGVEENRKGISRNVCTFKIHGSNQEDNHGHYGHTKCLNSGAGSYRRDIYRDNFTGAAELSQQGNRNKNHQVADGGQDAQGRSPGSHTGVAGTQLCFTTQCHTGKRPQQTGCVIVAHKTTG